MAENDREEPAARAETLKADVFVSYASHDAPVANMLVEALEIHGLRCWIAPRNVVPGSLYADEIVGAINDAKVVVLVLSEHAVASSHVGKEIERASSKRRRIIALRIDSASLNRAFEYFLSESQWIDLHPGGADAAAAQLTAAVRRHLEPSAVIGVHIQSNKPVLSPVRTVRRGKWIVTGVIAVLALAYVAVNKVWLSKHSPVEDPAGAIAPASIAMAAAIPQKSVAVLPFVDMSEKKDQAYFADGLSEELIEMLTKVPDLQVPARTSSFYFRDKQVTIADIAKALAVAHVLEGSVRKSGKTIRITAQLVRADNGYHVWSETYDRQIDDIFKVQDDIAGAVVKSLKVSLLAAGASRSIPTTNTDAYTSYLQARDLFQRGSKDDYRNAYEHLVQAVALDPAFAPAWSEIARVRVRQYYLGQLPLTAARAEAHRAIGKALQLDPQLAEAHLTRGRVLYFLDWDWQGADAEMKTALRLDPGLGESYRWAAMTAGTLGRFDEAEDLLRKALTLDPMEAFTYSTLSEYLRQSGHWPEATKAGARAHDLMPSIFDNRYVAEIALSRGDPQAALLALSRVRSPIEIASIKARAFHALGKNQDAAAALAELEKTAAADAPAEIARVYALLGERDLSFKWLDHSYELRDPDIVDIKRDRDFDALRTDPRYVRFLQKMNLPL